MLTRLCILLWLTGVVQPITWITMLVLGFSLNQALAATGALMVVAAEVAVRLLQSGGGPPALRPALA
ncbi:hypothetical protein AB0E59_23840 [Lentzea sp. NPDC034063]|uniref:hypothetical protein n=1 Tax=unclassified Lentzea TaxID=2643253 RepID=UPI0033F0248C